MENNPRSKERRPFDDATTEKGGRIAFEAKLGNSSESLLRYESSWTRDLDRAIGALTSLHTYPGI
jgi:hypothetical protein